MHWVKFDDSLYWPPKDMEAPVFEGTADPLRENPSAHMLSGMSTLKDALRDVVRELRRVADELEDRPLEIAITQLAQLVM